MNIELLPDSIQIAKKNKRNVVDEITEPIVYSPSAYGVDNNCTGKKVKRVKQEVTL